VAPSSTVRGEQSLGRHGQSPAAHNWLQRPVCGGQFRRLLRSPSERARRPRLAGPPVPSTLMKRATMRGPRTVRGRPAARGRLSSSSLRPAGSPRSRAFIAASRRCFSGGRGFPFVTGEPESVCGGSASAAELCLSDGNYNNDELGPGELGARASCLSAFGARQARRTPPDLRLLSLNATPSWRPPVLPT